MKLTRNIPQRRLLSAALILAGVGLWAVILITYLGDQPSHYEETVDGVEITLDIDDAHLILPGDCTTYHYRIDNARMLHINNRLAQLNWTEAYCAPSYSTLLNFDVETLQDTFVKRQFNVDVALSNMRMLILFFAGLALISTGLFAGIYSILQARSPRAVANSLVLAALLAINLLFIVWSVLYIQRNSYVSPINGQRYYVLADDALITMRYAYNLAEGNGLVWSIGDYVEGYTSLFNVLLMTGTQLLTNDIRLAPLVVQIINLVFLLGTSWFMAGIAAQLARRFSTPPILRETVILLSFGAPLVYYPFTHHALAGLETALWSFFMAFALLALFQYEEKRQIAWFIALIGALNLAGITRPETPMFVVWVVIYFLVALRKASAQAAIRLTAILAVTAFILPALQLIFRLSTYGELMPNTYILKATGWPVAHRIENGLDYVLTYFTNSAAFLGLAALSLLTHPRRESSLLGVMVISTLLYTVYVGGDMFAYWRILLIVVPFLFVLAAFALGTLLYRLGEIVSESGSVSVGAVAMLAVGVFLVSLWGSDRRFTKTLLLTEPHFDYIMHVAWIDLGLALGEILEPQALIGVSPAESLIYYSEIQYGTDFLGKADSYVAHLGVTADRSAGHNKLDLIYSIRELRPDYLFDCQVEDDSVCDFTSEHYVKVVYKVYTFLLLRDSEHVRWELVEILPS